MSLKMYPAIVECIWKKLHISYFTLHNHMFPYMCTVIQTILDKNKWDRTPAPPFNVEQNWIWMSFRGANIEVGGAGGL